MVRNAVSARGRTDGAENALPPATLARRIGWVALAGLWLFVAVSLASFDAADPPSHAVAVHNDPAANLCGAFGAAVAYWCYHTIGVGAWILVMGLAAYLAVTVTGRVMDHPMVRLLGLLMVAAGVSSIHRLVFPGAGPLAGAPAGLVAEWIVGEMSPRFNTLGTMVLLLGGAAVGAVVAGDQLVVVAREALLGRLGSMRGSFSERMAQLRANSLRQRGIVALAPVAAGKSTGKSSRARGRINPDAGGVGATDSFDPDEHELDDEYEYDDEYEEYDDEEDDESAPARRPLTAEELREKIAKLPVRMAGRSKTIARDEDIPREENFKGYQFPTLDQLLDPDTHYSEKMEAIVRDQAEQLEKALQTYGVDAEVVGIDSGPTVTLYAVQLAPGTKVAKINTIARDLARSLKAQNIRIVPNMVGRTSIGIEVPNLQRERVRLKELMSGGHATGMVLPMFLGKDSSGEPLVADLTRMPHMLIAGTTGSGKSVCMNSIIMSWLYTKRPDELKLVLVDPKMVELSLFADIPHLMCPVVTEMPRAAAILEWAVNKMEERYELLKEATVRDVRSYNALDEQELYERFDARNEQEQARIPKVLPYMVFIIDELADLIMTHKEVEQSVVRIAQKARAVGIHLILATQRPQANVVTGLIKSNMPCRASFKVSSGMDSRIVLDQKGADLLLGQGDMLFLTPSTSEVVRAQGTLVEDSEIRKVVNFLKTVASPSFERSLISLRSEVEEGDELDLNERDPLFDRAVEVMIESGRGSVSLLQRRLAIGYSRASRLVDQMWHAGILGDHKGSVAREVMISLEDWERMKELEEADSGADARDDSHAAVATVARSAHDDDDDEYDEEGEWEEEEEDDEEDWDDDDDDQS